MTKEEYAQAKYRSVENINPPERCRYDLISFFHLESHNMHCTKDTQCLPAYIKLARLRSGLNCHPLLRSQDEAGTLDECHAARCIKVHSTVPGSLPVAGQGWRMEKYGSVLSTAPVSENTELRVGSTGASTAIRTGARPYSCVPNSPRSPSSPILSLCPR